ncbi:MAG: hypothetical protein KBS60_05925, partial [Phascolarctobacterium sp.]|nr:hypothetical protein [Candidatus Phascolarctobacterium caballi]
MNNKKVVFRYAYVAGERITPSKGLHGTCPLCKMPVISKCGNKKVWHWAHCDIGNCDHWWENKTDWHEHWQDKFPPEWQEYIIENNNICHRADIYTDSGIVVEFQHSKLSEEEIEKREKFYIKNSNDM